MDDYEPSIEDYVNRIKYDDDPKVRANAVFVLGRLRNNSVIPILIDALNNDADADVRLQVVEVLGNFKSDQVIAPLEKALESDNEEIRAMAVKSLGYAGFPQSIPSIINMLGDETAQVRSESAEALGTLKAESAIEVLVMSFVADEDRNVRYFASQSLVMIGGEAVVNSLCTMLERSSDAGVLIDLIETLAKLKNPSAIDRLQPFTDHEDGDVSATAKWAISVLEKL